MDFLVDFLRLFFSITELHVCLMQSMTALAERSLPRSAENIALAVGALCSVRVSLLAFGNILLER